MPYLQFFNWFKSIITFKTEFLPGASVGEVIYYSWCTEMQQKLKCLWAPLAFQEQFFGINIKGTLKLVLCLFILSLRSLLLHYFVD